MREEQVTNDVLETERLGGEVVLSITPGISVALHGELGSGKTTFMHGVAKALGITSRVISPTFVLMRSYPIKGTKFSQFHTLYHVDLYRIESEKEIELLGISEILKNPSNLVFIEWAEKMGSLLPAKRMDIFFEYVDEKRRKITVNKLT